MPIVLDGNVPRNRESGKIGEYSNESLSSTLLCSRFGDHAAPERTDESNEKGQINSEYVETPAL